jgi:hypothetical protein
MRKIKTKKDETVYLSAKEVSDVTGMRYATVIKHIKSGILPSQWRGGISPHHRVTVEDMEYYAFDMWATKSYTMYDPFRMLLNRERHFLSKKIAFPQIDD